MATAAIGGLAINNPLQLSNTAVKPSSVSGLPSNIQFSSSPVDINQALNSGGLTLDKQASPQPASTVPGASSTTTSSLTPAQIAAQTQFNSTRDATMGNIGSGITTSAGDLHQGILDLISGNTLAQNNINAQTVQNELARDQGLQGVNDMVRNGIQGAGVQIDNAGAGTSSAAEQIARDYGIVGRQGASQVGNQYAQGKNTINNSQTNLGITEADQIGQTSTKKADTINSIVNNATSQLQNLNYLATISDIPDRVNIEQQIATVKQQALAALSAYDSELSTGNPTPVSQGDAQAQAQNLFTSGTAPASPFNFTTQAPASIAGTGPFPSSLPIFIAPGNKQQPLTA